MMGWYHDGLGWSGWLLMTLAMVLFWGLVIAAVVMLFRSAPDDRAPHRTADDVLDERFARGELTVAEYQARRDTLHAAHTSHQANPAHGEPTSTPGAGGSTGGT